MTTNTSAITTIASTTLIDLLRTQTTWRLYWVFYKPSMYTYKVSKSIYKLVKSTYKFSEQLQH